MILSRIVAFRTAVLIVNLNAVKMMTIVTATIADTNGDCDAVFGGVTSADLFARSKIEQT